MSRNMRKPLVLEYIAKREMEKGRTERKSENKTGARVKSVRFLCGVDSNYLFIFKPLYPTQTVSMELKL